jgi:predicted RNase H-like HicB family nuclease
MTMLEIRAEWDAEAGVWIAASEDVPGLVTEAATLDALVERLQVIIPELMELNCRITGQAFPFRVIGERSAIARAASQIHLIRTQPCRPAWRNIHRC